jgi:hypothetical protein
VPTKYAASAISIKINATIGMRMKLSIIELDSKNNNKKIYCDYVWKT